MIKSKNLSNFQNIKHGFFNKNGGKSNGIYTSLNCGIGSHDKKSIVLKNISIALKKLKITSKKIILLNQMHSNKFIIINKFSKKQKNRFKGDALITNQSNIAIGVLTADCVPILIYDKNLKIISAIHAGWRGAYKGIVSKVIKYLLKNGSNVKDLIAVIGPSITIKNYEVKKNLKDKFIKKDKKNKNFFVIKHKKLYFSLNKYIYSEIKAQNVKKIELIKKDTFDINNNFFSARRSQRLNENDYGRNISIIMLN